MKNESKFFAIYIHQTTHNYLNEYIYIYIYSNSKKRIMEPATEELINKTQLSPKIIPTSSRRLGDFTKESQFTYSTDIIMLPRTKVHDHHRYQPHGTKKLLGVRLLQKKLIQKIK